MSPEENKALARRYWEEVWNHKNLALLDELCAANFVYHDPTTASFDSPQAHKQLITMYLNAFPDLQITIEDMIAEGDKVVSRLTSRGTHQGAIMGIPPTGKQVTVTGIDITRVVGGKAVEGWGSYDTLGMLQQIGALPAPG